MFVLAQWNIKRNRLRIFYEKEMKAFIVKELNFKLNETTKQWVA
jgi:hypothetical protein